MVISVMTDETKKETFVESFNNDDDYDKVIKSHLKTRNPIRVFRSDHYKDAINMARVIARGKWKYNEARNANN